MKYFQKASILKPQIENKLRKRPIKFKFLQIFLGIFIFAGLVLLLPQYIKYFGSSKTIEVKNESALHYPTNDIPEITIRIGTQDQEKKPWDFINKIIRKTVFAFADDPEIQAVVLDAKNQPANAMATVQNFDFLSADIKLEETNQLEPGYYKIKIEAHMGGVSYVQEQDFTWGVLSFNPNKSIYLPNETAKLALAVLDETGHMVCDATVSAEITKPDGSKDILSTANNSIWVNQDCFVKNITENPDYEAVYPVGATGKYEVLVKAETKNGHSELRDFFEVRENQPFEVERSTATRIFPRRNYPVNLVIKANQDFNGTITEIIPNSFVTEQMPDKPQFLTRALDANTLQLSWQVDFKKGDTLNVGYIYDAPNVSPERYLLGPLAFTAENQPEPIFTEVRRWQLASDAVSEHYFAGRYSNQNQTGTNTSWAAVTGTAGSGTTASTNGWIDGTNFTSGEDYLIMVWGDHTNNGNGNSRSGLRVKHGGTVFTESEAIEELDRPASQYKNPYFWFTVWTASNEDIEVESYNEFAVDTTIVDDIKVVAINAEDLITNGDLEYDIDTTGGTLTTTPTSKADITWTPANASDSWWLSGYARFDVQAVNNNFYNAQLDIDSGTVRSAVAIDGEDANDTPLYGVGWATTFSASSHTVELELSNSASQQDWLAAGIFALRLNAFEDFVIDTTAGTQTITASPGNWQEIASISETPTATGNFIIAGGFAADHNDRAQKGRIQVDNTTNIAEEYGGQDHDAAGIQPWTGADIASYTASTSYTFDLDSMRNVSGGTNPAAIDSWLVGFSMELADPPTVTVSGNAYENNGSTAWSGCDNSTQRVSVVVNGGTATTGSCNSSTGAYSISGVTVAANNPISVFYNTAGSNTEKGVTASVAADGTSNISLNVSQDVVLVTTQTGVSSITNSNLSHCNSSTPSQCANVPYSVSGSNVTGTSGTTFRIVSGKTYTPGGNLTTQGSGGALHLDDNAVFTGSGSQTHTIAGNLTIDTGATLTAPSGTIYVAGNWSNSGTFTHSSGTVSFNGGTQSYSGSATFYILSITGATARTVTFAGNSTTAIANNGTLTMTGATGQLLTLQSNDANNWNLQVSNTGTTVSVSYVNVSRSNAGGYKQIDASDSTSTDGGNNTNWLWPASGPTNDQLMRHGMWFNSSGVRQFFTY